MGDVRGFLKLARQDGLYRPVAERVKDYKDVSSPRPEEQSRDQSSRCMSCGTPFCHWACPIGNYIPEWNDAMFQNNWREALGLLESTNNLPEVTG
ncbi:MAG TPA: glutamate synthase, partial [Candidatus Omnitrophota bacterium]|nr:glutamate synthase [Candidatus Omnitrophota bacterium]